MQPREDTELQATMPRLWTVTPATGYDSLVATCTLWRITKSPSGQSLEQESGHGGWQCSARLDCKKARQNRAAPMALSKGKRAANEGCRRKRPHTTEPYLPGT